MMNSPKSKNSHFAVDSFARWCFFKDIRLLMNHAVEWLITRLNKKEKCENSIVDENDLSES